MSFKLEHAHGIPHMLEPQMDQASGYSPAWPSEGSTSAG